jgi:hypothetical protein
MNEICRRCRPLNYPGTLCLIDKDYAYDKSHLERYRSIKAILIQKQLDNFLVSSEISMMTLFMWRRIAETCDLSDE